MIQNEVAAYTGPMEKTVAPERPWLFGLLIAPSAVVANGVIQGGVLAYLLTQQHVDIARSAKIVGLAGLPTMLYFLWAPITDFFVHRRTWLMLGSIGAAVFMATALFQPSLASSVALFLILISACCVQLVTSGCGGMMGAMVSEQSKRVASGFYQAGQMGFGALSLWGLLKISKQGSLSELALVVGALVAVSGLFALFAPKQKQITGENFGRTMEILWAECKKTFGRWEAIPYILLGLSPMGSGAAIGLLPAIAHSYGVSSDQVGWMNGIAGALLIAAGALAAPLIPSRIRASVSYLMVTLTNAAVLAVLWLGPMKPTTYFIGVTLYLFTVGTSYALWTAVILEFMGPSGKSGSGRYSVVNSLGNVPVLYMIVLDGWGAGRWGSRWLAGTDVLLSSAVAVTMLTYFLVFKPGETPSEEVAELAV
jgi:PAT family beta-lactamase induction signal transducer AmpG